jgi:DNA polymerase-3 subunit epsilon
MGMSEQGIRVRPPDTLLVERALDYLAAGPADALALVSRVCQLPGVGRLMAEQMAAALFADRPEFVHLEDGRWALAPRAPAGTEAGARLTPPRQDAMPTFDEWLARRRAAAPATPVDGPAEEAMRTRARRRAGGAPPIPPAAFGCDSAPDAALAPGQLVGPSGALRPPGPDDDLLSTLSYVVVDVETTGGRAQGGDRVTEIAAVAVRNGRVEEVYETLVNPQRSIPAMITAITNITWEMVRDQPTFREICPDVLRALRGNVFVAHNATFDWKFVTSEIQRATGEELEGRRLCTVRLARRLLPQLPRRSLDWVARHYGVQIAPEVRHRAAGDAVATAHVLLGLLRDAADRGVTTWRHLDELLGARTASSRRRGRSAMPRPIDKDTTA